MPIMRMLINTGFKGGVGLNVVKKTMLKLSLNDTVVSFDFFLIGFSKLNIVEIG